MLNKLNGTESFKNAAEACYYAIQCGWQYFWNNPSITWYKHMIYMLLLKDD